MDFSGGRGQHKLSRDDGNLSCIEPVLISPLRSDHPDSNRQLDLRIVPKTPGRHQSAPADLPDLEFAPSLYGLQHPAGSSTPSRQFEHSGGSAQQSDQASSNRVGSQLSRFQSHHSKMGGARNRLVRHQAKTVFLLKLASGRCRNELHALSCDEKCYRFRADGGLVTLITEPGFLAKYQKLQDSTPG